MGHLDKVIGFVALALCLLALAGTLSTDAYSHAAQAEASGYDALTHLIVNDADPLCLNDRAHSTSITRMHQAVAQ
jgi:hypothetical protein